MKYPWILFDADDTIFDFHRAARHALELTLEKNEIAYDPEHFNLYKRFNDQAWQAFENREISTQELRRIRFEQFLAAIGEYRDPLDMNRQYLHFLSETPFLVEGAWQMLEFLRAMGFLLGLITNGLREVQRPRIANAGLVEFFNVVVVSDEIGVAKPHEGFFQHTFIEMGNPGKEEVLVVGDSLRSDILGGISYGVDTCWYNPRDNSNFTSHQPTYEINHLNELKKILLG